MAEQCIPCQGFGVCCTVIACGEGVDFCAPVPVAGRIMRRKITLALTAPCQQVVCVIYAWRLDGQIPGKLPVRIKRVGNFTGDSLNLDLACINWAEACQGAARCGWAGILDKV